MPGYLIQVGAMVMCPHGGAVQITSVNVRVKSGGQFLATMGDVCAISGCAYQMPGAPPVPLPCLQVKWSLAALRVKICGQPALVDSSIGLCMGNVPAPPQVRITQLHVRGM